MTTNTPAPWQVGRSNYNGQFVEIDSMSDGKNTLIGHSQWSGLAQCNGCYEIPDKGIEQAEANAAHIVKAVNYHGRLVDLLGRLSRLGSDHECPIRAAKDKLRARQEARALLAELGEEK